MNRAQTLSLYERAQNKGIEVWNDWANKMLKEQKKLKETGEWNVNSDGEPANQITIDWFSRAEAVFSENNSHGHLSNTANFKDFIFPGEVQFRYFKFTKEAFFSGTVFHQRAFFDYASFHGLTLFTNTSFNKWAIFENAIFHNELAFEGEVFKELVNFKNVIFEKDVSFKNSFKDIAFFESAHFKKLVDFNNSKFYQSANFSYATFEGLTKFQNVKFYGITDFQNTIFTDTTLFDEAKFYAKSMFDFALFKKVVHFDGAQFMKNASFATALFDKYTSFKQVVFKKNANLNAIQSDSAFNLEKATFEKEVPDFIQANFKEAPRLDNIKIGDDVSPGSFKNSITTFIHPDIKARYQALKRLAVQAHDHENEQKFWAGELRSDRSLRNEDGSWNRRPLISAFWWGNIAYGCFSDYGSSIVKPLGTLLLLVILMTGLHLSVSKEPLSYENAFSAGYISASKSIFNLGADPTKRSILKEKYSGLYGVTENQTPDIPKSILIAEMGQTLLSAIFIFLTLLGVRNNFKMK